LKIDERLVRLNALMDQLEDDFENRRFKAMGNKYNRIGFHVSAIEQAFQSGVALSDLNSEDQAVLKSFQKRYSDFMNVLLNRKQHLSAEQKVKKRSRNKIAYGYFNKSIVPKSRHINITCK